MMKISLAIIAVLAAASEVDALKALVDECSPLEFVNARGTGEPTAPAYGVIIGDPLFIALKKLVPDVTGYSVNYPASSNPCSRDQGSEDVIIHLKSQSAKCPNQKYALVGYSQGAGVMHQAMSKIDSSLYPKIIALVMFGDFGNKGVNVKSIFGTTDPAFPPLLAQRLKQNCITGDPICAYDGTNNDAHLSYSKSNETYIPDSASYIAKQLQTSGNAGPQPSPKGPGTPTPENLAVIDALTKRIMGASGTSGSQPVPKSCTRSS